MTFDIWVRLWSSYNRVDTQYSHFATLTVGPLGALSETTSEIEMGFRGPITQPTNHAQRQMTQAEGGRGSAGGGQRGGGALTYDCLRGAD